jgi:parallel beta-helix repeat protein
MTQRRVVRSLVRAAWLACAGLALTAAAQLAPFGAGEQPTETAGQSDAPRVSAADLSTAPRVDVDKPVELIPLYLRDKRIHGFKPLQELIDAAPEGGVLNIPSGRYAGPVHLKKPLTLVGQGEVVVDGGDKGTVFVVETNGATLRHLTITGSGDSHDSDDGCLNVRGHRNTIEDVTIADCLFGIDLKQSHDNLLRGNRITSKPRRSRRTRRRPAHLVQPSQSASRTIWSPTRATWLPGTPTQPLPAQCRAAQSLFDPLHVRQCNVVENNRFYRQLRRRVLHVLRTAAWRAAT